MQLKIGDTVFIEGAIRGVVVGMEGYRESWSSTSGELSDFYFDTKDNGKPIIVYAVQTEDYIAYCEEEDLCRTKKSAKKRWGS